MLYIYGLCVVGDLSLCLIDICNNECYTEKVLKEPGVTG